MKTTRSLLLAGGLLLAAGCGGGSSAPVPTHAVGVAVSGLAGAGLVLHLGPAAPGQDLAVSADGAARFAGALPEGTAYAVTVKTQPTSPWQDCAVAGGGKGDGSGTMGSADAAVTVTCATRTFSVGGSVSGLTGPGLSLRLNGGAALAVDADGGFTFPAQVASGATFHVAVATHPQSPRQACEVVGTTGDGTVQDQAVTSVQVTCRSDVHAVGGSVTGREGDGLLLRLTVGGVVWSDDLPVSTTSFSFPAPVPEGEAWQVSVSQQPTAPWQTCTVTGGSGVMGTTNFLDVAVACTTNRYAVGGHVTGLLLPGLSLTLDVAGAPGTTASVDADGAFTFQADAGSGFPGDVRSGAAFLVTVGAAPATQACTITGPADVVAGTAVMAGAAVDVTVACGCAPGLGNCDGLPGNGCEQPVTEDAQNCGACGHACAYPHAAAACVAGACQPGACDPGFLSCDGNPDNGCEQAVSSDPLHCGGCTTVCSPQHSAPVCSGGACGHGACSAGFGDCDGNAANGCEENVLTSVANCGACGSPCTPGPNVATESCTAGQCAVSICKIGFGNCNGRNDDGCEADLSSDPNNCGACTRACSYAHASGICSGAPPAPPSCSLGACDVGWDNCDGNPLNGCEAQVDHDPQNCGACGHLCPSTNGTAGCLASQCVMTACDPGFGDCQGSAVPGCETNLTTDPQNCGGCGVVCAADQVCSKSACSYPSTCQSIKDANPNALSGVYRIDPDGPGGNVAVDVYCYMTADGTGWTFLAQSSANEVPAQILGLDVGSYQTDQRAGSTYSLGASVYAVLQARPLPTDTELMVTVGQPDPIAALGDSLVTFRTPANGAGFAGGPVPCTGLTDGTFSYRLDFGAYQPGFAGACDEVTWLPADASGGALIGLEALVDGTFWGVAIGGDNSWGHPTYWYAR